MEILLNICLLVIGVVFLMKGADLFVASSSSIAKKMKISPIVIGLTVVAFGTSAPELAVSVSSSIQASLSETTADIAMGNVVGSNIINLLMVLGLSALVTPIIVKRSICKNEFLFLILSTITIVVFSFDVALSGGVTNVIQRGEGIILLLLFILFLVMTVRSAKGANAKDLGIEEINPLSTGKTLLYLVVGLAGIVVGAQFVTDPATYLATKAAVNFGVDETLATTLVGLTVVAFATSLPELITSVVAAKKGENEIALGNIIGSNIFNTVLIAGAASVVAPLGINSAVLIDLLIMTAITLIVFVFAWTNSKISKKEGLIMVLIYIAYLTYIILRTAL